MADAQIGMLESCFANANTGAGAGNRSNLNGANTDAQTGLTATTYATIAAMRTRLAAISGYYTAAVLNGMTVNDMQYAIRVSDNPTTLKQ